MLKDKSAVVTGSTSGIGLAIAHALAGEGCHILLNGFGDPKAIEQEIGEFKKRYAGKVAYSPADMSKPAEIEAMLRMAEKELGGCDILINNAGIQHTAPVDEFPAEKWDAIIAINLSAAFHAIKAALPGMKKRDFGRIVNIASVHGLVASKNKSAYVAAKHGLVGLTKVVALEAAEQHITCNAICPGWVHTPLVQKQIEDKAKAEGIGQEKATQSLLGEKEPTRRFTRAEEIAAFAVYLCGESAGNITGGSFTLDGGWTAQ